MRIRKATDADTSSLTRLFLALYRELEQYDPSGKVKKNPQKYAEDYVQKRMGDERSVFFVLDGGKDIIGYVLASIKKRKNIFVRKEYGYIYDLYVLPAYRGKMLAEKLIAAVEDFFNKKGIKEIELQVLCTNEPALRFYAKHGWGEHRKKLQKLLD